jgi:hypothetical protein
MNEQNLAIDRGSKRGLRLAIRIGLAALASVAYYLLVISLLGSSAQAIAAVFVGWLILLIALRRLLLPLHGIEILAALFIVGGVTLAATALFRSSLTTGSEGLQWGISVAAVIGGVALLCIAARKPA